MLNPKPAPTIQALHAATVQRMELGGSTYNIYSLPRLEQYLGEPLSRLPVCLRILLESVLRNGGRPGVTAKHVLMLAQWQPQAARTTEIPFVVGRIVLQDVAGIPLLCDLAGMRSALRRAGRDVTAVTPHIPVNMVIDHSLEVDHHGKHDAMACNMRLELSRNAERFQFVKWAMGAFDGIQLTPPGQGILHQINLEHFAHGLLYRDGEAFPDTLVGTDSHTCMIAGMGVVGWGVGGIEAEAAVLGQPIDMLIPDVVGVRIVGELTAGVTATDLVLHLTQLLRKAKVVGKFVEFCGDGVAALSVPDRATVANMAPEYGATMGYFPFDDQTVDYMRQTGRPESEIAAAETYFRLQGCFGPADPSEVHYSTLLTLDLATVSAAVAGPSRPQDLIPLAEVPGHFSKLLPRSSARHLPGQEGEPLSDVDKWDHGVIVIAAIASCTNTSNPELMLAAGLLARKACARGMRVPGWVKTSLTPGSQVVGRYLAETGLQRDLDALGFNIAGYGCATCVGNSGPLLPGIEQALVQSSVTGCAVLSGNRNFEARIHHAVRAAFLMSPPLVVAYALAGRITVDLTQDAIGRDGSGQPVFLRDLWPDPDEIQSMLAKAHNPRLYRDVYQANPPDHAWAAIPSPTGDVYAWEPQSTYIQEPPYFREAGLLASSLGSIANARALAILGDSVTTDHISPIGTIAPDSPAGVYLKSLGVPAAAFNNYGSRRMNHEVMVRGTFANRRLKNAMCPQREGGFTCFQPDQVTLPIYDAAMRYREQGVPLIIFAGEEYGTGSARDWAAKGTRLLGVRAVVASSFERIHRSNLVGMGVLPCQLPAGISAADLGLDGSEIFSINGLDEAAPRSALRLRITRVDGKASEVPLTLRLDTTLEIEYARRGGILPYLLESLK